MKLSFQIFVILCAVCSFSGNSFAQESAFAKKQIDSTDASDFLSRTIADGSTEQKRDALLQIRNLETEAASRLAILALKDSSEIVRATATASVVFLPKDEAARILLPLLADKKPLVRREAAYALGTVGSTIAIDSLLQTMRKDKVLEVRSAAIVALGAIGDESAIGALIQILQRKPQAKEEFMRRSAARSIGQIAQIIQTGKVEILTPENFLPEKLKPIATPTYPKLAEAVPQFRPALNVLIQTLGNSHESPDVKREAAFALGAIGDESAIFFLQKEANDADYYLAEISREALRKIHVAANR